MERLDDWLRYYSNPKVEYLFGFFGGSPIPTKQEKYKRIEIKIDRDGSQTLLDNIYEKKPDKNSVIEFKNKVNTFAKKVFKSKIIEKPNLVEVILSITITERRFKEVDIDNLAKTVLDGLVGSAFEDDSQVASLIAKKSIHPMKINSLLIGISKLSEENKGIGDTIKLYSLNKFE